MLIVETKRTLDWKNLMAFDGARMADRRIAMNMSQTELGNLLGMTQMHVSDYERGIVKSPRIETIGKIAAVLKTTISYLVKESDDPEPLSSFEKYLIKLYHDNPALFADFIKKHSEDSFDNDLPPNLRG